MGTPRRTADDLVEPEGVNAGSAAAERDRQPDGDVPASAEPVDVPDPPAAAGDELVGGGGQRPDRPGQQLEAGEG
jgi:hypothetical protein